MTRPVILTVVLTLALVLGPTAQATTADAGSTNMSLVGRYDEGGKYREGTDLAFWRNTAVLGKYHGIRLLDIADPTSPKPLGKLDCFGNQGDVSIWRNLVFMSIDQPLSHSGCDAPAASAAESAAGTAWEGIRIIDASDRTNPRQIDTVYTDCGSHTHTLVPDLHHRDWRTGEADPRVLLYSLSYPLNPQGARCNAATQRKFSVVSVPLDDPSRARVVSMPDVSPAIGCHDVTVFTARKLAAAACITESQIWDISNPAQPVILSRIRNPQMQIHHSSAFSWDGDVLVLGDEKGGAAAASGCMSSGSVPAGALWFYDISDPIRPQQEGWYVTPQDEPSNMCTAHNFNVVPVRSDKRILTASWYHGGTHVIDFTDPSKPTQIGWYKASEGVRGNPWSSYWYRGSIYANNFDAGYVPAVPESRGLDVLKITHPDLLDAYSFRRLNPQTQESLPNAGSVALGSAVTAQQRREALARNAAAADTPWPASLPKPYCVLN